MTEKTEDTVPPSDVVPPSAEEVQHILNTAEFSVSRPSPMSIRLESTTPRVTLDIRTTGNMFLPDRRVHLVLPEDILPQIISSVSNSVSN